MRRFRGRHTPPDYRAEEETRAAATGTNRPLGELVVVDDNQDQGFLAVIKKEFRQLASGCRPGAALVGKVKFRGSGSDELIRAGRYGEWSSRSSPRRPERLVPLNRRA